ncbi:hypothetical protein ABB37_00119 [Leptomonas pyrrhocoris]|uniref:glutathione-specific gamma-glutamylcyclotransferase n=1 Tax=Leptomonas pyrrhocoris TaxID=157538 RepID=A0A0M9G9U1_LEPPY|nr:hypothetical protein ABB37_00119 [Leptomonas pyrrhocoris]KPA85763.1 hypothetical protein ABB37_00119 [Leptomonas pyrrhocoris]|eukprot:XP_015664202.1 hypothetical protein ABB37_00119 [Leptomonas pyrrhocoris]
MVASPSAARTHYHEEFNLPSFDDNIFLVWGYGSILWKQEFEYEAEYDTYIKGYKRVFYQGSKDHRGTPERPGRVVTLLPTEDDKEARVYGKAYQLPTDPAKLRSIFNALDTREQGGYERLLVTLYDAHPTTPGAEHELSLRERGVDTQGKGVVCLCYNGTAENKDYLGPDTTDAMARHILGCTGPSGPNREYLFFLADSLRAMKVDDPHVFELEAAARRLLAEEETN